MLRIAFTWERWPSTLAVPFMALIFWKRWPPGHLIMGTGGFLGSGSWDLPIIQVAELSLLPLLNLVRRECTFATTVRTLYACDSLALY
jgi:hypothetical protein